MGYRLIIVGGGIAGLDLAIHLRNRKVKGLAFETVLVDREAAHVWKPMLHTIAAGTRDVSQQQTSYILKAKQCGFTYQPGALAGVNLASRTITISPLNDYRGEEMIPKRELGYDTLILAIGSRANDFDTPGVPEHCYRIDSRTEALNFNDEVRSGIVRAQVRNQPFRVIIIGGGATGVELAAELVSLARLADSYGATGMSDKVKITLIESGDRLLKAFPHQVSSAAKDRLEKLGVTVQTSTRVVAVDSDCVHLKDGGQIEAEVMVWAAGVTAPSVLRDLGKLELSPGHQIVIRPDFQSTRDEHIYALGDCASLMMEGDEHPLPPTAQVAFQQSRYLQKYLPSLIAGDSVPQFKYRDFGSLVALGGYDAFGSLGKFGIFGGGFIRGRVAQLGHAMLYRSHQVRLNGFWAGTLLWLLDKINARLHRSGRMG